VPVSIIGTFAVTLLIGYSANTVSLLALVLAIGIVVDDAIVVVENIERVIEEEPDLSVPDACKKAMAEITGPILAVLLSVFVPAGAPTHVPARLRLSACQPGYRHAHPAGVSRPSQHPAHRALH
jgi:multidrug efflux pump subunit AcrB